MFFFFWSFLFCASAFATSHQCQAQVAAGAPHAFFVIAGSSVGYVLSLSLFGFACHSSVDVMTCCCCSASCVGVDAVIFCKMVFGELSLFQGFVIGGFQRVVRALCEGGISVTPFYLKFASVLPLF